MAGEKEREREQRVRRKDGCGACGPERENIRVCVRDYTPLGIGNMRSSKVTRERAKLIEWKSLGIRYSPSHALIDAAAAAADVVAAYMHIYTIYTFMY